VHPSRFQVERELVRGREVRPVGAVVHAGDGTGAAAK
jgi:hypothetical protein